MNIIVIGATGMIGKPVTRELIAAGFNITLLVRNIEKARSIFPGVQIVQGDVFDIESLTTAFTGQDAVYISLAPPHAARVTDKLPEREGIENIIAAAQQSSIKRIVLLSSLVQQYNHTNGFNWWVFDVKQAAVEKIKSSGIAYSIFYPSTFMESFDQLMLKGNRIMLAGRSIAPMYFIAASDYGRQVAWHFRKTDNGNKEYVVQGPAAYNWDEGSKLFIEHYQPKKLKTMKAPLQMLQFMGRFSNTIGYGAKIVEALNRYPEQFAAEPTWNDLGKPTTTIEEYASKLS
ncbi:MAG: NAD(P)H-binding protein [Chitinophagaceae bacterium]